MTDTAAEAGFSSLCDTVRRDGAAWVSQVGGLTLHSHFQPIYSLSHGRPVGHEALLRAVDGQRMPLTPAHALRGDGSLADALLRDRASRLVHMLNFAEQAGPAHWLFCNMHPQVFLQGPRLDADGFQAALMAHSGLEPHRLVIEVLEDAVSDEDDFDAAVALARRRGCLLALDDFGAGHSNFDRVWRIQPDIVKLDRSLVARAAHDRRARRVVTQMTSLLHQCGALVLMEGVETQDEAFVALEADADFVQGFLFANPQARMVPAHHTPPALQNLWDAFESRWMDEHTAQREHIGPYTNAIGYASALLSAGRPMEEALASFLALPGAEVGYLLGADARQIGINHWAASRPQREQPAFEPMRNTQGARWARRPYYRRAIEAVGRVQVTRPYRTLHGAHLCVTVSVAFRIGDELNVVCGDVTWQEAG